MKKASLEPSLMAIRDGKTLRVLGIARISGGPNQTELSLADQGALYRAWIEAHYEGPYTLTMIAGIGSGECLDREDVEKARSALDSGQYDLVICEDIGRIMRRMHAFLFCEAAEDIGTRLIAINDHIDTGRDDWRLHAFFASMRHEMYNADTAKRIRRTQRSRFMNGGMVRSVPFCYSKPENCKSDAEVQKDPECNWAVLGIIERLEADLSYSEVADWLNENNVPISINCQRKVKKWNGALVRDFLFNTLLKGERQWNNKKAVRVNKTGKRKAVKASPDELLKRSVPHLAYISAERYDALIFKLIKRGEKFSVPKRRLVDPRKNRPKKRTRWPGQHAYCELCGEMFVFGGHGQKDHLMCNGARAYNCWNGVTFECVLAAQRISQAVFKLLSDLPEFDSAITAVLHEEATKHAQTRDVEYKRVLRDLERAKREEERLVDAVKQGGDLAVLLSAMKEAQSVRQSLEFDCRRLEARPAEPVPAYGCTAAASEARGSAAPVAGGLFRGSEAVSRPRAQEALGNDSEGFETSWYSVSNGRGHRGLPCCRAAHVHYSTFAKRRHATRSERVGPPFGREDDDALHTHRY